MIIYVGIDGTICNGNLSDHKLVPSVENIQKMNKLYDEGHQIIYWSNRGSTTGKYWLATTITQFEEWGVKYTQVKSGRPFYDVFIDSKNIKTVSDLFIPPISPQ